MFSKIHSKDTISYFFSFRESTQFAWIYRVGGWTQWAGFSKNSDCEIQLLILSTI
jgi:hypothetical protein